jgi:hypothetical protein
VGSDAKSPGRRWGPVLFLLVLTALHPVPGVMCLLWGLWTLSQQENPGSTPLESRWWTGMSWRLGGALILAVAGGLVHQHAVLPLWAWATRG